MGTMEAVRVEAKAFSNQDELAALCQPFHFSNLGNEQAEKAQLMRDLGWKQAVEVGKFYDHAGSTSWYWYVYGQFASGQAGGAALPQNTAASKACGKKISGDVVLVKSGPLGGQFSTHITVPEVVDSIMFYVNGKDSKKIFSEREYMRAFKGIRVDNSSTADGGSSGNTEL